MSNVAIVAHMETEAITEHWFGEEYKGSDQSGGECGHGDVRVEEEEDGNDDNEYYPLPPHEKLSHVKGSGPHVQAQIKVSGNPRNIDAIVGDLELTF
ncbi:hypothetical protein AHAS_Ahas05G0147600 [Arachis hypogaea]